MSTASQPSDALYESHETDARLLGRGKALDIYELADDNLLIVTSDRISAFDVVLPTPIPGKGHVLTALSAFWFAKLAHLVPNHLTGIDPLSVVAPSE